MVGFVTVGKIRARAFRAESAALCAVAAGLTGADLDRPSGCPPWTVAGLLGHIIVAAGRVQQALGAAFDVDGGSRGALIGPRGYYRPDHRFSPAVNSDRIDVAAEVAARLHTPAALAAALRTACEQTLGLLADR